MKTMIAIVLLVLAHTASALTPAQISKTFEDGRVRRFLGGQIVESVQKAPSYRCLGCFALRIQTKSVVDGATLEYIAHGQYLHDTFKVELSLIDEQE